MGDLSFLGGISVLQNTILGPGLLAVPWAVAQCGNAVGLALLVLSAAASFLGMRLLSTATLSVKARRPDELAWSLGEICELASGRRLRCAFEAALVLACSGALLASLMIIGDNLQEFSVLTRGEWIIAAFCVAFPLSCLQQLSFLRFSSFASLTMIVYITGLVVWNAIAANGTHIEEAKHEYVRTDNMLGVLQAIPVFTFSFCGHMNVVPIVVQLSCASLRRMDAIIFFALVISGAIYITVSQASYISFGNRTPQDILNLYPHSTVVGVARIGITIVCAAFYPLLVLPVRATILGWFPAEATALTMPETGPAERPAMNGAATTAFATEGLFPDPPSRIHSRDEMPRRLSSAAAFATEGLFPDHPSRIHSRDEMPRRLSSAGCASWMNPAVPHTCSSGASPPRQVSTFRDAARACGVRYWSVTVLIGAISLTVALSTTSLGKVFSLSGATGFSLLCNVCPAWLYLSVDQQSTGSGSMRVFAKGLMCFGIVTMPVCIAANVMK